MKTRKQTKQGISLIVLVITIIVMIILAAAIILSLSSNGIIDRANEAVDKTDEKQMQVLASTLWAEEYLAGKRGANLVEKIDNELLALDSNYKSKYDVTITNKGVNIEKKKEEWLTMFEGEVTGNMVMLENCSFLKEGYKYRITIESDGFNGSIDTFPRYMHHEGAMPMYGLFALYGNSAMGIEPDMNVEEEFVKLGSDAKVVVGTTAVDNDIIIFQGSDEYTVTKVEITKDMVISGIKIYEGDTVINLNETIKTVELNPSRNYMFVIEVDECIILAKALPEVLLDSTIFKYSNDYISLEINADIAGNISSNQTVTIKAIYDVTD